MIGMLRSGQDLKSEDLFLAVVTGSQNNGRKWERHNTAME